MSDVLLRVQQMLNPILESLGLFLWDIELLRHGPRWLLRIYIDKDAGVTLDDCEAVSRDLGTVLDVEDAIPHAFTLEVSSPGLDRTLRTPEHFKRFIGNVVKVKTFRPIDGQKVFRGELAGIDDDIIRLRLEGGGTFDVPLKEIAKASLEVEF